MESLTKDWKEVLEMKNPVIDMKTVFDGLISSLDRAKKKISGLEDVSIKTFKIEMQREKWVKRMKQYTKTVGQIQKI